MKNNSLNIFMKSQKHDNCYEASAQYCDGQVVILKDSKVASKVNSSYRLAEEMIKIRSDRDLVSEDGVLVKDIEFNNLSRAACFVAGYSVNGLNSWKTLDGVNMKQYKERTNE